MVKICLGMLGIWLNQKVLCELKMVRTQQVVNMLVFYICLSCQVLSGLHLAEGLRFLLVFEAVWRNGWIAYIFLVLWLFLTSLICFLVVGLALVRYLYVFKKSTIR